MTATAEGLDQISTAPVPRLGRLLGAVGLLTAASFGLPFLFLDPNGPDWYHLAFHLIGIPLCVVGILVQRALRRAATSRLLRVISWIATVGFVAWGVGHTGELVTVLAHGGAHADPAIFEHPVHTAFASIAIPGWMLSVLSSLVLLAAAGIRALTRRSRGR